MAEKLNQRSWRTVRVLGILFLLSLGMAVAAEASALNLDFVPFLGGVVSHTSNTLSKGVSGGFYLLADRGDFFSELYFRAAYDEGKDKVDSDRSHFWYELEADAGDAFHEFHRLSGGQRSLVGWALNIHGVRNSSYVDESLNVNLGPSWSLASERTRISVSLGGSYYDYVVDDEPARDNGFDRSQADFEVHGGYLRLSGDRSFSSGNRLSGLAQTIVDQHGNLFESRLRGLWDLPLTPTEKMTLRSGVEQRFFDLGSRREILDFDSETLARVEVLFHW